MTTSLGEQAATCFAGLDPATTTRVREFVAVDRIADYAEVAQARREHFGNAGPVVVTVVVEQLWEGGAGVRIEATGAGPGGSVHLPTILPVDGGEIVSPGDFRGQYTWCLERAAVLLDAVGLDLAHLVRTIDFSTPASRDAYRTCHRPRKALLGPVYPGAAGILVPRLPHPDALVGFELTASRSLPVAVNPGWERYATLTYNPAVSAGGVLYGSGFAALDPVTQQAVHEGDPAAQSRYTYDSIAAVLTAAGAGPADLVAIDEYVTPAGVEGRAAIAAARAGALPGSSAAVTTVGCATLLRAEFLLEAIPTAVLR